MAQIWQRLTKEAVYPGNWLTILWRIIARRDTLFPNANFLRFIEIHAPSGVERFDRKRRSKTMRCPKVREICYA